MIGKIKNLAWLNLAKSLLGVIGFAISMILAYPALRAEAAYVAYTSPSGANLSLWLANDQRLFSKHSLDIRLIYVSGASKSAQAMVSGQVPIALLAGQPVVDLAATSAERGDLIVVGGVVNVPALYFMVRPEIKDFSDLRKRAVGVTRAGSTSEFVVTELLRKYNLKPGDEVKIIQTGDTRASAAMLQQGIIAAAAFSVPMNLVAEKAGARVLVDMAQEGIFFPQNSIVTTMDYLRSQRDFLLKFLRAYSEGVRLMHSNKSAALKSIAAYTKTSDPELLEATYNYALTFIEKVPTLEVKGLQKIIDRKNESGPARRVALADVYDPSLLSELEQRGFFRSLWAK